MATGEELVRILKSNSCFYGLNYDLFFIDEMKSLRVLNTPFVYIINTKSKRDSITSIPGHWIMLFSNNREILVYFDSLGQKIPKRLEDVIVNSELFKTVQYVKTPIQGQQSFVCGAYIIICIYSLFCKKKSLAQFVELFSVNTTQNDKEVSRLYNEIVQYDRN